jgi:hypothetical protein
MAIERWEAGNDVQELRIKMADTSHLDQGYSRPIAFDIAAILPGTGEEVTHGKRDIIVQLQDGPLKRVSKLNSSYCTCGTGCYSRMLSQVGTKTCYILIKRTLNSSNTAH